MNQLQEKILDIYKDVKKICEENNLVFFAIGGTCIGAVRHHGFIPWDDDLDIVMPREDYEKFKNIAKSELNEKHELLDEKFSKHYESVFIKVHDKSTTLIHESSIPYPDRYSGVFIDIMPLDGLPNNMIGRNIHLNMLIMLMMLNSLRKDLSGKSGIKKIFNKLIKIFPRNTFLNIYLRVVKIYSYSSEKNKNSCFAWSLRCKSLILTKKDFEESIILPFEDTEICCPIGFDEYLTTHFGNYMEVPTKDKQIVHDNGIVDLEKSYKLYRKEAS